MQFRELAQMWIYAKLFIVPPKVQQIICWHQISASRIFSADIRQTKIRRLSQISAAAGGSINITRYDISSLRRSPLSFSVSLQPPWWTWYALSERIKMKQDPDRTTATLTTALSVSCNSRVVHLHHRGNKKTRVRAHACKPSSH